MRPPLRFIHPSASVQDLARVVPSWCREAIADTEPRPAKMTSKDKARARALARQARRATFSRDVVVL
eukprot:306768-Karenia_brevis.AAC.1